MADSSSQKVRVNELNINLPVFVGSTEAPSKVCLLFFLLPDWLKLNHLKSRMECGFSDMFSRHFCSTVAETIGVLGERLKANLLCALHRGYL